MRYTIVSRNDPGEEIAGAIARQPAGEALEIVFPPGDYFFTPERAFVRELYITNATTVPDGEPPVRRIGILLENAENVILSGYGATLWFDGRMTEFALIRCRNVEIRNVTVNFIHPSVFEFDVVNKTLWSVDIRPNRYCPYTIQNGRLKLPFDELPGYTILQERDERAGVTRRVAALSFGRCKTFGGQLGARETGEGIVRVILPFSGLKRNVRYQLSNPFRDGVGTLIDRSERITLNCNTYRFMHGLGITAQLSEDISILDCDFLPDEARNLTTSAAADMIHACMCKGTITVRRCRFAGARDDVINVHGVHFMVTRAVGREIDVRFCQRETYGFCAFNEGDAIEFVDPKSLNCIAEARVCEAILLDPRSTRLTLDRSVPTRTRGYAVENATKTCGVLIDRIDCRHIPTRGILVSTRGKVVIQNSKFHSLPMANVLIADDARGWFESGRVSDVLIQQNVFEYCGAYPVDVRPESRGISKTPVHRNIRIVDNDFLLGNRALLRAKRTEGLVMERNRVYGTKRPRVRLIACQNARIQLEDT